MFGTRRIDSGFGIMANVTTTFGIWEWDLGGKGNWHYWARMLGFVKAGSRPSVGNTLIIDDDNGLILLSFLTSSQVLSVIGMWIPQELCSTTFFIVLLHCSFSLRLCQRLKEIRPFISRTGSNIESSGVRSLGYRYFPSLLVKMDPATEDVGLPL